MEEKEAMKNIIFKKWVLYLLIGFIVVFVINGLRQMYSFFNTAYLNDQQVRAGLKQNQKLKSDRLFYSKMDSLYRLNQYDVALQLSRKRISEYPEEKPYLTRQIGNIYYFKGDYDSAIIKYTKAISMNPNYVYAYGDRGWAFMELDSLELAIQNFEYAAGINFDYYFDLGIAQERKGLKKDAIKSYDIYLKHYPNNKECKKRIDALLGEEN